MPYKRTSPENIEKAKAKQREYNARYRSSAKGQRAHRAGQARWYAANKDELNASKRAACVVCGGPKEAGKGFRKCNECWGVRAEKELDALIAEQQSEMYLGNFQPPQRFGNRDLTTSTVLQIDWRDEVDDEWSDPTADEVLAVDDH